MRDVLPRIRDWRRQGRRVALATVVRVWGSAPRPLGSKMAMTDAGDMAGSVSGGCVEGAVLAESEAVLAGGEAKLVAYGVSDETAWSVGLSCGGTIEVFIEPLDLESEVWQALDGSLEARQLVAVATVLAGPGAGRQRLLRPAGPGVGDLGSGELENAAAQLAAAAFAAFASRRATVATPRGEAELFLDVYPPPPKLIIVGAVHVAIPLVAFAGRLGFRTVVIDPRTAFATAERFAEADELIRDWPSEALAATGLDEATYVAVLSHDLKIDLPALEVALRSPARYVGALGSRKTHGRRIAALEESGFSATEIGRIRSPIGLDLGGGRRAEEIALSVIAEVVKASHGG
jgi:xanthine dehydrogenase accessory factor